jgi:hypothetical protein
MSRLALGPTQLPIQWVLGALSPGAEWPGHKADHSLPSSAKFKNTWTYTSIPSYVFKVQCLVKHRDTDNGNVLEDQSLISGRPEILSLPLCPEQLWGPPSLLRGRGKVVPVLNQVPHPEDAFVI